MLLWWRCCGSFDPGPHPEVAWVHADGLENDVVVEPTEHSELPVVCSPKWVPFFIFVIVAFRNGCQGLVYFGDLDPHPVSWTHTLRITDDVGAHIIVDEETVAVARWRRCDHLATERRRYEFPAIIAAGGFVRAYYGLEEIRRFFVVIRAPG